MGDAFDSIQMDGPNRRVQSATLFSQPFMRDHTEFESFDSFCAHSPWSIDTVCGVQNVSRTQLDDYVAETTDFETWEAMKTRAAAEEIVDQLVS